MLSSTRGNSLYVEIKDYISGIFHQTPSKFKDPKYAGKLQFMLQGIKKTVSCSSQYISYSLEYQLCSNLSRNPKFDKSLSVKELIDGWDEIFKGDALSLVAKSHRPLIARWLKWALLIHDLREALAKNTCVGVIGLVKSGKSQLIKTLFDVEDAIVGTTTTARTTVPFMYNMDGVVDGLDVIDFPGVDDSGHSVPELAKLLLGLVQVVIFVVDYRRISSDAAIRWIRSLEAEDIPLLVCLTHADRLYVEAVDREGSENYKPSIFKEQYIGRDLQRIKKEIGHHPSREMEFYCFHKPSDSKVTTDSLKKTGIRFPQDVGHWLVHTFRSKLGQGDLAKQMEGFVSIKRQ